MKRYFRNTGTIYLRNGEVIDSGSLWRKKGDILILEDEDRYVEHDITMNFEEVSV